MKAILKHIKTWSWQTVLIVLLGGSTVSILISLIMSVFNNNFNILEWAGGLFQNLGTEMVGALVTYSLFERILGIQKEEHEKAEREAKEQQEKAQQIEELKKRLVREVGGQSNEIAKAAVDRIHTEGWSTILKEANLRNANLRGAYLEYANLQQTDLSFANLQQSDLSFANLQQAFLIHSNLEQANLQQANLQQANLYEANLQDVTLWYVNLQQADLREANLREANLYKANLQDAKLDGAKFNEKTVLPDSEIIELENGDITFDSYWTPETDMSSYTDSNHPNFYKRY